MNLSRCTFIIMGLITFLPASAAAQPAKIPFSREPYFLSTGPHNGQIGPSSESYLAFSEVIQVPEAPWLRLLFQAYDLGREMDTLKVALDTTKEEIYREREKSHLVITSLEDGGTQRLDAVSIKQWRNTSAYFNGDALEIELFVAPEDKGIFFEIQEVMVGESDDTSISLQKIVKTVDLCGDDDRISSSDAAVGRILEIVAGDTLAQCTGYIISSGIFLTAGHCWDELDVLEFNVPASEENGWPNFADPDDQYPVDSIDKSDNGVGDDWAVFDCFPNSNTGLLPAQAQDAFYRVTNSATPSDATIRVTGCGKDRTPSGPGGGPPDCPDCNSDSRTLQTDTGAYKGEFGTVIKYHKYEVDTEPGNSGSPIIYDNTGEAIGVHTYGSCGSFPYYYNVGTSFRLPAFQSAINTFRGTNVNYVDNGHTAIFEYGTVFAPYKTVNKAVNEAASGEIVSIVKGYYNETMTISNAMTITAPVGMVTIGAGSPPPPPPPPPPAPTGLYVVNEDELDEPVELDWDDVAEATSYKVYWRIRYYPGYEPGDWSHIGTTSQSYYTDYGAYVSYLSQHYLEYYVTSVGNFSESDPSGSVACHGDVYKRVAEADGENIPSVYSLGPTYPNPFNPVTTIRFGLPEASKVSIVIYDIMGREVISWDRQEPPGYRQLVWNGKDRSGRLVPSGIYLYRLEAASTESDRRFTASKKMLLLK